MITAMTRARLNQFLVLFVFVASFTSCLTPKKLDKWMDRHYGTLPQSSKKKPDYMEIKTSIPSMGDAISVSTKKTSNVLPLVFYWQMDYKNTCTLNPQIPISTFTSTAYQYANSKGLKQKLNGRRIELSIDTIPNVFAINDEAHMIWFVLYAYGWDYLTIQPQTSGMVVSYKIIQDNVETKTGVITVPNTDKGIHLKMFQSTKKKTWEYLGTYNSYVAAMSKSVIDKLIMEI